MKRLVLFSFICTLLLTTSAFADTTYSAKSTAKTSNQQEVIKLDVMPVVRLDGHQNAAMSEQSQKVYVAPLIEPAEAKVYPTLNFNLGNIKNVKKGAILPEDNVNQSTTNVSGYFNAPYDKVFSHLLGLVEASELEIVSYDTDSGRIFVNYRNQKPIYITVSQYNKDNVLVKITPADGVYDIPASVTEKVFNELNRSLNSK